MAKLIGYSVRNAARIRDTVRYVERLQHDQTGQRRNFVTSYKLGGDVKSGRITAVTGTSTAAVYDAESDDGTLTCEDTAPINRPFGTAEIIAAGVNDLCLMYLDGETVILIQLTETIDWEDCV